MKQAIIIFVRNAVLGEVKTRLATTVGDKKALAVYNELLLHTKNILEKVNADKYIYYYNAIEQNDLWNANGFLKKLQSNDELGLKMKTAFDELFTEGYQKLIIIGSDCFQLTSTIIKNGFSALDSNNAVIGPAKDGGYYLLGLKKMIPAIFKNKTWSTSAVFKETMADFALLNMRVFLLPALSDIDTEEDLVAHGYKM